jgi:dCMP deaminase
MIINAGIKKIYYQDGYADSMSEEMFQEAGVEVIRHTIRKQGEEL